MVAVAAVVVDRGSVIGFKIGNSGRFWLNTGHFGSADASLAGADEVKC